MPTIKEQVELYFNTLHKHSEGLKGGVFEYSPQTNFDYIYQANFCRAVSDITYKLNKYKNNSIFVTLNTFRKTSTSVGSIRKQDNLWGLDTIMIDIDGDTELCGLEDDLVDVLKWAWDSKRIPKPNLISYTGGGGIHLYYTFHRLPKSMENSVRALKWAIAEKIVPYEEDFPYRNGHCYRVDTKVFDTQRMDRVPGSINPKTSKMCVCYTTGQERYSYQELLSFMDEDSWNALYKIKDAQNFIGECRNHIFQHQIHSDFKNKVISYNALRLAQKRMQGLFRLAQSGKNFVGCREVACFMLRTWCMQLNYSDEKEIKTLYHLNSLFDEPLSQSELINNTKPSKAYSFTNKYIISVLNLTPEEQKIMFEKYRPGDRKRRTQQHKCIIAKLVLEGKTIKEISKITGLSESIIKRRRTEMKKSEGFEFWANMLLQKETIPVKNKETIFVSSFFAAKSSFCRYINTSLIDKSKNEDRYRKYREAPA